MPDRVKVENLLWELCRKQDEITHLNESGTTWGLRKLKEERAKLMRKILEEVFDA